MHLTMRYPFIDRNSFNSVSRWRRLFYVATEYCRKLHKPARLDLLDFSAGPCWYVCLPWNKVTTSTSKDSESKAFNFATLKRITRFGRRKKWQKKNWRNSRAVKSASSQWDCCLLFSSRARNHTFWSTNLKVTWNLHFLCGISMCSLNRRLSFFQPFIHRIL